MGIINLQNFFEFSILLIHKRLYELDRFTVLHELQLWNWRRLALIVVSDQAIARIYPLR